MTAPRRMGAPTYEAVTRGIKVRVRPRYLPEQSDPSARRWVWGYWVEIENGGGETVQLVSRRWVITDALGRVEEVQGLGVVGEQPVLRPGEAYTYVSGCPLASESGTMAGAYQMITDGGDRFEVEIPAFSLDQPDVRRTMN